MVGSSKFWTKRQFGWNEWHWKVLYHNQHILERISKFLFNSKFFEMAQNRVSVFTLENFKIVFLPEIFSGWHLFNEKLATSAFCLDGFSENAI